MTNYCTSHLGGLRSLGARAHVNTHAGTREMSVNHHGAVTHASAKVEVKSWVCLVGLKTAVHFNERVGQVVHLFDTGPTAGKFQVQLVPDRKVVKVPKTNLVLIDKDVCARPPVFEQTHLPSLYKSYTGN